MFEPPVLLFLQFMRLKHVLFFYCTLLTLPSAAQVPERAEKLYMRAMEYQAKKDPVNACATMQQAIAAYGGYTEAYSALGEWYFNQHKFHDAAALFRQASAGCKNGNIAFAKPLAKCLLYDYKTAEAMQVLSTYNLDKDKGEWQKLKDQAAFMQRALNNPWPDTARNLGLRINSRYAEMYPCISADTQTLYFTRRVNGVDEDFFKAKADSCGGWFKARNMGTPPNTPDIEAAQVISGDGHYLFFMRCENRSENGWDKGGCDLYMAYTGDSTWSIPQSFGATINTPAYEGMPCLSADNRELFFVSNRDGGFGGLDIWVSRFEDGLWQAPRNLGPEVNTAGDETAPFIHIDNNTLYFASNGLTGMGGSDLFYCKRTQDTLWTKPQNLGYPINSTADETGISITLDGRKAFFASDRDSVAGNFDLYEINLPQSLQPVPVAIIKGYSYDSLSKDRLNYSSIYITDAKTGAQLYHFVSNRGDGSYMMTLPVGKDYVYNADRIGYSDITDTIHLAGMQYTAPIEYNIALLPQDYVAPINDSNILTIFFPRNSARLTDDDKNNLRTALDPFIMDKHVSIMVNGYTDNTGTPLINEQLSFMRAGLVAKEINALGVEQELIRSQGWGEANPIAPNDTEEGMTRNRRVEVIIRR